MKQKTIDLWRQVAAFVVVVFALIGFCNVLAHITKASHSAYERHVEHVEMVEQNRQRIEWLENPASRPKLRGGCWFEYDDEYANEPKSVRDWSMMDNGYFDWSHE